MELNSCQLLPIKFLYKKLIKLRQSFWGVMNSNTPDFKHLGQIHKCPKSYLSQNFVWKSSHSWMNRLILGEMEEKSNFSWPMHFVWWQTNLLEVGFGIHVILISDTPEQLNLHFQYLHRFWIQFPTLKDFSFNVVFQCFFSLS